MKPRAVIEWICRHAGILRLYRDGDAYRHGDPYYWCCTVARDDHSCELMGAVGSPGVAGARAIIAELRRCGITQRTHRRLEGESARVIMRRIAC